MKNRTNIKLVVNQLTVSGIQNLSDKYNLPYQDFIKNPHCTIIYSNDVVDVKDIRLPKIKLPITAKDAHFELFDTKYDGTVLVIEFDCKTAKECFEYVKKTYNLSTRYDEYRAHITLQKNIKDYKDLVFPEIPFDIVFDEFEMDNGE